MQALCGIIIGAFISAILVGSTIIILIETRIFPA